MSRFHTQTSGLGWGLRMYISNKLPHNADDAGSDNTSQQGITCCYNNFLLNKKPKTLSHLCHRASFPSLPTLSSNVPSLFTSLHDPECIDPPEWSSLSSLSPPFLYMLQTTVLAPFHFFIFLKPQKDCLSSWSNTTW